MTARRVWWCQRANGPLMARKVENYIAEAGAQTRVMPVTCQDIDRAGDGNRTRMTSLEGWSSTIELRPQPPPNRRLTPVAYRLTAPSSSTEHQNRASERQTAPLRERSRSAADHGCTRPPEEVAAPPEVA